MVCPVSLEDALSYQTDLANLTNKSISLNRTQLKWQNCKYCSKKQQVRAREMAQQIKVLGAKSDDLREFNPGNPHGGRKELTPARCLLTSTHSVAHAHPNTHTFT